MDLQSIMESMCGCFELYGFYVVLFWGQDYLPMRCQRLYYHWKVNKVGNISNWMNLLQNLTCNM